MADIKITNLPLGTDIADDDQLLYIDVSDTTAGPLGTDKRILIGTARTALETSNLKESRQNREAIEAVYKAQGYNNVFFFEDGFTYTESNDVGIYEDGTAWTYADAGALPVTIVAGTVPSAPDYQQVTFNDNGESVQDFIDSFALKIFQSPTDGGLTEIQTRTVGAGEVYEVRKTSDDSLATIYSDAAGTTEIVQDGTSNVSDSAGVVEFYIADGGYYVEVDSVKSNFTTISQRKYTVSQAKSTNFKVGERFNLIDREGAEYIVRDAGMIPNELELIGLQDGFTAEYVLKEGVINPQHIGAKTGAENASVTGDAINRAIAIAFSFGDPFPAVELGAGSFYTDKEIDRTGNGNYVDFKGFGQRNTRLSSVDSVVLNCVIRLAGEGDIAGRTKIQGLTIVAGDETDYCINAKEMRYWIQDDLELIRGNIACEVAGNWVVKLNNTRFVGRVGLRHEGIDAFRTSSNNFTVTGGDFTRCSIGINTVVGVNELTLNGVNFDACRVAGYKCDVGIKSLKILGGCTFEATGVGMHSTSLTSSLDSTQTTFTVDDASTFPDSGLLVVDTEEMSYTKSGNTFTVLRGTSGTVAKSHNSDRVVKYVEDEGLHLVRVGASEYEAALAPVVCGYIYNNLGQSVTKGSIRESNFNNTSYESAVILYNCKRFDFDASNYFLSGYNYDSVIELRGAGCTDTISRGVDIYGGFDNVERLVNLDKVNASQSSNLKIDQKPLGIGSQSRFIVEDPTSDLFQPAGLAPTIVKSFFNGFEEYTFESATDGEARAIEMEVDFTSDTRNPLLGRYISINYMTKGVGGSGGVWCRVYVGGVEKASIARPSSDYRSARGQTVYIPKDCVSLRINLRAISSSVSGSMYGFKVCDSALI